MKMVLTAHPTHQDLDEIKAGLIAFNSQHIDINELKSLGLFVVSKQGEKLAGLTGSTTANWLRIDMLWVSDSLRGQGVRSQLIKAAETEAIARGCRYAQVDTASFQARPFYEKLGYEVRFSLDHYPRHHQRHYLTKSLSA